MAYLTHNIMNLDCESTSGVDLSKVGAHRYSRDPSTVCYQIKFVIRGDKYTWRIGQPMPGPVIEEIMNGTHIAAHNREFDVCMWNNHMAPNYGLPTIPIDTGICTAAVAAYNGMPRDLKTVAKVREYPIQKDAVGNTLMRKMLKGYDEPLTTGFSLKDENGDVIKKFKKGDNLWRDAWVMDRIDTYCDIDTEANGQILTDPWMEPLSKTEYRIWQCDQRINNRGVYVNKEFLNKCIHMHQLLMQKYQNLLAAKSMGRIPAAGSDKEVLQEAAYYGVTMSGNNKEARADVLADDSVNPLFREVIQIISCLKKVSCSKFYSMRDAICEDGRIRGMMVYYGALRTGRWAARLLQLQNMTGNADLNDEIYEILFDVIMREDVDALVMLFGWKAMDALSWCVRPTLQAAPGKEIVDADYSAIEARVLAWGADETWRLEFFRHTPWTWPESRDLYYHQMRTGEIKEGEWPFKDGKRFKPDIYVQSYSAAFNVPYQQVTKKMRKVGKVQELALGYFGGDGAMLNFGADKLGMDEAQRRESIRNWRNANKMIKRFWYDMEKAAIDAVQSPGVEFHVRDKATFFVHGPYLKMRLPSGRCLKYYQPSVKWEISPFDGELRPKLYYWGRKSDEGGDESKKWTQLDTYGGKLVENWTQAVSRDITANAIVNLDKQGHSTIFHVHDEVVDEEDEGKVDVKELCDILCDLPSWAHDLPVAAAGWKGKYFKKD